MRGELNRTLLGLVKSGEEALGQYGIENPRLESEMLLSALTNGRRLDLYLAKKDEVDTALERGFKEAVRRRGQGEPVQYITGQAWFLNRCYFVGPGVLIPRPETEQLVVTALSKLKEGPFLDLGTGSGCIALSILLEHAKCDEGYAVEISPDALAYARANAKRFGIASRVKFIEGDMFEALPQNLKNQFEMILSNPPYLDMDMDEIDLSVRNFEPGLALDGGRGGLDFYRKILRDAGVWLKPEGYLILEIGLNQVDAIKSLLNRHSCWQLTNVARDEQGIQRVLTLLYKGSALG